jgi:4-amino-4-deoxy-L-arabinose transferase-like glycosyltransferase
LNLKYFFSATNTITFSKKEIILIFTFFIITFIIRFYELGDLGFNNDEAIYAGQAASLANYSEYQNQFSIFRAHPLLLQFMVSISFYFFGISEFTARIVPVLLSCGIIVISYFIAKYLYNLQTAILSSFILSLLSYHIIISKQVIVDVSMSFFFTLDLLFIILYYRRPTNLLLYGIGITSGLCFLSKEIGIISLIISIISIIIINKKIEIKNILVVVLSFIFVTSPYWISLLTLEEARESLLEYIYWQSSRPGNHDGIYYFEILFNDILGYVLSFLVLIAYLYILFSKRNWNFRNIVIPFLWIFLPLMFYQLISVKGYHFPYSLTPFFVIFGISILSNPWIKKLPRNYILLISVIPLILISNKYVISEYFFNIPYNPVLGSESVSYMRDAALWIKENTPKDSTFLTLYTHMSNIIKFYAQRDSIAIQANNNPSYEKLENIDMSILAKNINYIVYEKIQINNGKFLENKSSKLEDYVQKYQGSPIYTNYQNNTSIGNTKALSDPAIIVYAFN